MHLLTPIDFRRDSGFSGPLVAKNWELGNQWFDVYGSQ